jgi:hypothetical protein
MDICGTTVIHDYDRRLEAAKLRLSRLANGQALLAFIDHLKALGLSDGRLTKYANHLCVIMRSTRLTPQP